MSKLESGKSKRRVQKVGSPQQSGVLADLLQTALAFHQAGNLDAAETCYTKALHIAPQQPDALHYLGVISHQRGDHAQADSLIRQAITAHPIPGMFQNLAVVLAAGGDKAGAVTALAAGVKRFPEARMLAFNLAGAQRDAGDWPASRDTLAQLVERHPAWPEAIINLANAESNLGNRKAAEQHFLRALVLKPEFAAAHSNLGALYVETDRMEPGIQHNRHAVAQDPTFAPYHYNLGNALLAAGRASESLACFEEAVRLAPDYISAWLNLAAARQMAGDIEGALEANRQALELSPNEAKAYINQGNIALQLRRHEEGLSFLKRGLQLEPDSFTAWSTAGEILRQLGQLDDARVALNNAMRIAPAYGRAVVMLALVEEQGNHVDAAEHALRQAFKPPHAMGLHTFAADRRTEARLRLANLQAGDGRKVEASAMFDEALTVLEQMRRVLKPLPAESASCARPMVLLHPIGRAGSLFLHSLIDGHPQVSTTPGALLKGFFGEGVWEGMCPNFADADWREVLVARFCLRFAALLDAESNLPVPGNPLSEPTYVGRGFGLCNMGTDHDQVLRLDSDKFKGYLLTALAECEAISAPMFFRLIHRAYDASLGWPDDKPVVLFHIHNPDVTELAGCLLGNPDARFLNIVRDPLQAIESWMKNCMADRETAETLLLGYQDAVERLQLTIRQASHLAYERYPSATIRLEDIKRQPNKALPALAAWMGVDDHPCLRESSFAGLEYSAPSSTPVKGFETSNLERKPGALFSEQDQRVMNILLYPIAVQYGYREADPAWLKQEVAWYRLRVAIPLDFEQAILARLKEMGYQKDTNGPRRHFESIATRCLNLLEQFGTYPAMAPWLKVEK